MTSPPAASPDFQGVTARPEDLEVDLLCIPIFQGDHAFTDRDRLDQATDGEWSRAIAAHEFQGRAYELFVTRVTGTGWKARRLLFVGGGAPADASTERLRRLAAAASYTARQRRVTSVGWVVPPGIDVVQAAVTAADGLSAAEFDAGSYKRAADRLGPFPKTCLISAPGADLTTLREAVRRGRLTGEAVNFARSLANEPGNVLPPREFAARVTAATSPVGLQVEVLDETRLRELGMRLLLAVGQGSTEPPRMIVIRYDPPGAPASPVLGFIGKGVTFDTGGISIKPAADMDRMKDDMSGGAAVAGAMWTLAQLRAPYRVIGLIPTAENMLGGQAMRPGDVVVGASGTSVEIMNTDAEGRLILADALWYARQLGATHLIDVATLTGAMVVALGKTVSGVFGTPEGWVDTVRAAADRAGDRLWPMPIYEEAREQLRSEIADLMNVGGRPGGASVAAAFLKEFAGDGPWAHLDIAGTAWSETKKSYQPKGATGVALRTLIEIGMTGGHPIRSRTD